jgi:hypothetical protein
MTDFRRETVHRVGRNRYDTPGVEGGNRGIDLE